MSAEEKRKAAEEIGTLSSCLIEGNPEQKTRERKIKRRALGISVVLQSVALVALVLVPLLGKTEKLPNTVSFIPMPPYRAVPNRPVANTVQRILHIQRVCLDCFNRPVTPHAATRDDHILDRLTPGDGEIAISDNSNNSDGSGLINLLGQRGGPAPPEDPDRNRKKRISVGGIVQQAMLIHRVEPIYPPLARQVRVSGQVHLRAIISTDGSIESLQVMDGHPLLVQSSLDAVRQWRYKPTLLNGQAVEVDTIISVIYSLGQQ